MKTQNLILGGGPTGLAAAWRLAKSGREVILLEKNPKIGGLSGGIEINGNHYEFGPHMFHTNDREIMDDIKSLMGDDLITFNRTVKIKFMGEYFSLPLSLVDVLGKIPRKTLIASFFSFIYYFLKSKLTKHHIENSETVLLDNNGLILYEIFFKSYIKKVWGISPDALSPEFARQRIPRMNIWAVLEKIRTIVKNKNLQKIEVERYVEKVAGEIWTTKQGFSLIYDRMGEDIVRLGGNIINHCQVKKIIMDGNQAQRVIYIHEDQEKSIECRNLISTIPINLMFYMLSPPPPDEILRASDALKFRATLFVGILVNRKKILPASFIYFRDHIFNRVMDYGYFPIAIKPKGATIVIAEVNCNPEDKIWSNWDLTKNAILQDFEKEELFHRNEVLEMHPFRAPNVYPIYLLGYEKNLETLLAWVDGISNFQTTGRQGLFQYVNSHVAIRMGYNAADQILNYFSSPAAKKKL